METAVRRGIDGHRPTVVGRKRAVDEDGADPKGGSRMDGWLLVAIGSGLVGVGTLWMRPAGAPTQRPNGRPFLFAVAAATSLLVGMLGVPIVNADHTVTTSSDHLHNASTPNGFKVYLSSPRHASSGSRGECGWEENRNGRNWNWFAHVIDNGGAGSLFTRGYNTIVSANSRDDGFVTNKNSSNNWGADVHIVTHTNASNPCNDTPQYLLVMYSSGNANSTGLRTKLIENLDPVVPGGQNTWNCDALIECNSVNAPHRAYLELFFHTNQSAVNWYQAGGSHGTGVNNTWRVGLSVDQQLGYPR